MPLTTAQGTTPGDALQPPPQRATPARTKHAVKPTPPVPGTHGQPVKAACPNDGRPGEGQHLTPGAPHNGGRPAPPGTASCNPRGTQLPAGHVSQKDSAGPQRRHTRAHSKWAADPDSPPRGQAAGGGRAPDPGRPSQRRKAPPPGAPSPQLHTAQRQLARAHALGPVRGPPCPHRPGPTNNGSWMPRRPPEMGVWKRDSA